jgi:hypothetical protein
VVFRAPGTFNDANTIRIMAPNSYTPYTYIRYMNGGNNYISPYSGQAGSNNQTHYRLNGVVASPR